LETSLNETIPLNRFPILLTRCIAVPKREDEFWKSKDAQTAYCRVHKRYYRKELGCQLCYLEKQKSSSRTNDDVTLIECPNCHKISLWWNKYSELYECLNTDCKLQYTQELHEIKPKAVPIEEVIISSPDVQGASHETELIDPMLLSVKMFLADVRSWKNKYRDPDYVCADFAKEVFDAATLNRMRCGYVIIFFSDSDVAHAIVCFETDCGLKYFEPQTGNEEDVFLGKSYSVTADGVPKNNVISRIEIEWNDGTKQVITE